MAYASSLLMGVLVGVLYALLGVRSPAPPVIALVGLLGIVLGEAGTILAKQHFSTPATSTQMPNQEPSARPPR